MKATRQRSGARRPGRPSKLTPIMRGRFLDLVRQGISLTRTAKALGIHPDTVTDWCRDNPDFSDDILKAREQAILPLEDKIIQAANKDWRAAAWLLERWWPEKYGRRQKMDVQTSVDLAAIIQRIENEKVSVN